MSAVAQICHQLEGLPLAIELATAQLRTYSPERVNELMSDRFSLLTRGGRARSARMQTLRASIGWSYELCSAPEQELWARVSVFSGSFELDAVQGVCAGDDLPAEQIPDLVAALVAKSVLISERPGGATRYRLLEAVRQYGEEHLRDSGQYRALRRRHRDWCEQLTAAADADWLSPRQVDWMARLDREHAERPARPRLLHDRAGEGRRRAAHAEPQLALLLLELRLLRGGPLPVHAGPGAGS